MDSLLLIAVILIVLWGAIFAFYFGIVRNQKSLENEIDTVETLLAEDEPAEEMP